MQNRYAELIINVLNFYFQKADEKFKAREKSSLFESRKIGLREAKGIFGLWDNVHSANAVKALESNGRWDPSKLNREMAKKKEMQKLLEQISDSEEESEESSDEDEESEYDDEGNKVEKKKDKKEKRKKDKTKKKLKELKNGEGGPPVDGTISNETMKSLLSKTAYTEDDIKRWHFNFMQECPSAKLSKAHLQRLCKRLFPIGDCSNFCDFIFRLFDDDGNNVLEFPEFLQVSVFNSH